MSSLIDELREQIAKGDALIIVGAGVSIAATGNAPTASWVGLLRDGIAGCEKVGLPKPKPGWGDSQRQALTNGDLVDLLAVASQIEQRLGGRTGGEFRNWLREAIGALDLKDRAVLEALRDLSVPMATTNYDGLIEEVTGHRPVTWRDGARVQRVVRGGDTGVLHFHGFWELPESVVLGSSSYDEVLGDTHAQAMQSALAVMKSFLFVGCGEGLSDPNFGNLLESRVLAGSEYRHYRLCLNNEQDAIQQQHPPGQRIFALPYGDQHEHLAAFLRDLKPTATTAAATTTASTSAPAPPGAAAPLPPPPARMFGRENLRKELVDAILLDPPAPIPILGGPGFGKSTLCLAALHDPAVLKKFCARRWFVRCDAANRADDVWKEIALGIGVPVGSSLAASVTAALAESLCVLVLDNFETPWEGEQAAAEMLLSQVAGIPGVVLAVSVRGQQRPFGPSWRESLSVTPLGQDDSQRAFLAIAGARHVADSHLSDLMAAMDGIPLSIELTAYAAEAEPNLDGLWRRWQEERADMLRRGDGQTRLDNAAVSFELSIKSRRMNDEARQLLQLLAVLPDGIAHEDLPAMKLAHCDRAASTLRQVGLALDEAGRLRVLAPVREHVMKHHQLLPQMLASLCPHYVDLAAQLGAVVGRIGGDDAARRVAADARNIEVVLLDSLGAADPIPTANAAIEYAKFLQFSGVGTPRVLERAREVAARRSEVLLEARCTECLGDIALARSEYDAARARYEEALPLYQKVGSVLGEANCIQRLGSIAFRNSERDSARSSYEEALGLYQKIREPYSIGLAHRSLGRIAETEADRAHHVEAARQVWSSIKRDDLIKQLDVEFGH